MNLPINEGIELINKALEKKEEGKAWQMWLAQYPNMTKKTFTPFSEFYKKAVAPIEISQRPAEEILNKAAEIRRNLGR